MVFDNSGNPNPWASDQNCPGGFSQNGRKPIMGILGALTTESARRASELDLIEATLRRSATEQSGPGHRLDKTFLTAALAGSLLALLVLTALTTAGTFDPFAR